ncbi:hypothetical protein [Photobacterium carnosum]|uniref:hypothetical protein n=1 Tax=Photobacterium carnosum TaxID=2023717 RepID=UPI001E61EF86|nr:hypothetical protein [Photobacterium carnosum]MCD9497599.1 hypothetical protein [Photobacterium carnosum]
MLDVVFLTQKQADIYNAIIALNQSNCSSVFSSIMYKTAINKNSVYSAIVKLKKLGLISQKKKDYLSHTDKHVIIYDNRGSVPAVLDWSYFYRSKIRKDKSIRNELNHIWR